MAEPSAVEQELKELREAVVKLTVIQGMHAELLKTLADERLANATYKGKIGGIVIATSFIVSALWGLVLSAPSIFKSIKGG